MTNEIDERRGKLIAGFMGWDDCFSFVPLNMRRPHKADELAKAIRESDEANAWRPIEEAPRNGTLIIVPGGMAYHGNTYGSGEGWISLADRRLIEWEVKVWQPLPEPPK